MSPDDNYATCPPDGSCGCCVDALTDPEEQENEFYDVPDDITPAERLLWAIFGKQPPEEQESDCDTDNI